MHESESVRPGELRAGAALVIALADLIRQLEGMAHLEERCEAIAGFAVEVLGADLAGVSIHRSHGARSQLVAPGGELAPVGDVDGPLDDGSSKGSVGQDAVWIADTRADERWPRWSALAAQQGVLAVLLLPVARVGRHSIVLELYSRTAGTFDDRGSTGLEAAATVIGLTLGQVERSLNLEKALGTRDMIGQAQGMVMERYGLGSEQAMEFLRRISQDSHAKIQEIARRLVRGDDPPPAV